ncbi:hypothetical protein QO058_04525 [Bosea vestrisii]|uniref:hypothetical protein n=1 Tax=Bosea vestrisii TaxID=151416 RepID=UPI0024DF7CB0|nr:hypothetical protein [Bosea vestrisii]WID97537.1 hypothetical protein QO058_04525 [Bosea vestrisii]
MLRPLVNAINRSPIDEKASEATYEVVVTTDPEALPSVREAMVELLEQANYPVDVNTAERGEEAIEIVATLISTAVERKELDAVVERIERLKGVTHATWESSTSD